MTPASRDLSQHGSGDGLANRPNPHTAPVDPGRLGRWRLARRRQVCELCRFFLAAIRFQRFRETRRFQAEPDSLDSNRRLPALPKAGTPQWVAAQKLRTIFSKKPGCPAPSRSPHRANRSPFAGSQRSATYRCDRKMVAIQRDKQSFHIILKSPFGTRLGCACQWHDRLESLP